MEDIKIDVTLKADLQFMYSPKNKTEEIMRDQLRLKIADSVKYLQQGIREFLEKTYV